MCSKSILNEITSKVSNAAKECLGDKLDKVFLYGSYARGDSFSDSDIDILVLANIPREDTRKIYKKIWSIIGDLDLEYNVFISIHVTDCTTFYQYANDLPFYMNVLRDGVELSA